MRAGLPTGEDRRGSRFHSDSLEARLAGFDHLGDAGDGAPRAHAGHNNVHLTIRISPDLLGCGATMDLRVGRVLELLGNQIPEVLGCQFLGPPHRSGHPLRTGSQNQLGSQGLEQSSALHRHGLWHGQDQLVASGRTHKGQGDACIAIGWFQDDGVLFDQPSPLRGIHHADADSVFDAGQGVEGFQLGQYGRPQALGDRVQSDQRGVPNGLGNIVIDSAHVIIHL